MGETATSLARYSKLVAIDERLEETGEIKNQRRSCAFLLG
jgi:hypothetical protein